MAGRSETTHSAKRDLEWAVSFLWAGGVAHRMDRAYPRSSELSFRATSRASLLCGRASEEQDGFDAHVATSNFQTALWTTPCMTSAGKMDGNRCNRWLGEGMRCPEVDHSVVDRTPRSVARFAAQLLTCNPTSLSSFLLSSFAVTIQLLCPRSWKPARMPTDFLLLLRQLPSDPLAQAPRTIGVSLGPARVARRTQRKQALPCIGNASFCALSDLGDCRVQLGRYHQMC